MKLTRTDSNASRTLGVLKLDRGPLLYTCEPPWLDNEPFISCVPVGIYTLEDHNTDKYPDTWALVGDEVGHWPGDGKQRSVCVLHAGNTAIDTMGCILPGTELGEDGVLGSRSAMGLIREYMAETDDTTMVIVNNGENDMTDLNMVEAVPSSPSVGASRDFNRTIAGFIGGAIVALLSKIGFDLSPEIAAGLGLAIMTFVSSKLAGLGKQMRQADSPTGLFGQLF